MIALSTLFLFTACSQPYGKQSCTKASDCTDELSCIPNCGGPDGGQSEGGEGLCYKSCAADSDCGDLGLTRPTCAVSGCSGMKFCVENPF